MILDSSPDYAHVTSALQHEHEILINDPTSLLIHCTVSNVYIAEYQGDFLLDFYNKIKTYPVVRLQTTNRELYNLLIPDFLYHYDCIQAVFDKKVQFCPENFQLLKATDLKYAAESYGMEKYITQLYERNRLFGYYEKDKLIGYAAFHIDESVGALFVKPEFRKMGYGKKILEAAFNEYSNGIKYTQILKENTASVRLHEALGCSISSKKVCWVYNREYEW